MKSNRLDPHYSLLAFLLLSLLLHGTAALLLPPLTPAPVITPQPIPVELRSSPAARPRELDAQPPETDRSRPAQRLGPVQHQTDTETAPRATGNMDRPGSPTPATAPLTSTPASPPTPAAREQVKAPPLPRAPLAERAAPEAAPATNPPSAASPSLDQLTQLPSSTVDRLERKERDVAEGALSLDMENDILLSFFRRFRLHVLQTWNYPRISRERNEQGQCLVKVVVAKDGSLADLQLLEGSGYAALDEAALEAVRRSSPYGALSSYYPKEKLEIRVLFIYQLWNRPVPGDIYRR